MAVRICISEGLSMKKKRFRHSINFKISIFIALTIFITAIISSWLVKELFTYLINLNLCMDAAGAVSSVMEMAGDIESDEEIDKCLKSLMVGDESICEAGLCTFDDDTNTLTMLRSTKGDESAGTRTLDAYSEMNVFNKKDFLFAYISKKDQEYAILQPINNYADNDGDDEQYYIYVGKDLEVTTVEIIFLLIVYLLVFFILMIAVRFIIYMLIRGIVTRPIKKLAKAAEHFTRSSDKIKDEKFFSGIDIKSGDEIEDLALAMQKMEDSLHEYMNNFERVTEEKQRISTEIEIAAQIQANMLPKSVKDESLPYRITSFIKPARIVGGDFYDYFRIDDDRVALVIADVSDKGVPASLFMVKSRIIINNSIMANPDDLVGAIENANRQLCSSNEDMMFVTVFACIYVISSRKLFYVNAGHENPVVYRAAAGEYSLIKEEHDVFLGIMDDQGFVCREIELSEGDKLFLYTDGVTDVADPDENLFGEDGIVTTLNRDNALTGEEVFKAVLEDLDAFRKDIPQPDDITMLLLEV